MWSHVQVQGQGTHHLKHMLPLPALPCPAVNIILALHACMHHTLVKALAQPNVFPVHACISPLSVWKKGSQDATHGLFLLYFSFPFCIALLCFIQSLEKGHACINASYTYMHLLCDFNNAKQSSVARCMDMVWCDTVIQSSHLWMNIIVMGAKRSLGHAIHLGPSVCPYPSLSVDYLLPTRFNHGQLSWRQANLTLAVMQYTIRQTDIRSDDHCPQQQLAASPGRQAGRQLCMIKVHPPPETTFYDFARMSNSFHTAKCRQA